ncbi:hypothetical protein CXF94_19460 [Halomonas sp. Choline-3u-9]|uniref:hypothetical protein n=1 Tax=unclassified Halomonas TaxID=2609666 RepID=UPI0004888D36|nr:MULTISPECIES: hypothetical protein [unclassified Halomonas]PKH59831.1 hypothetical protein CXF94_19460 [Halomonas sp. Choline-3u-9]
MDLEIHHVKEAYLYLKSYVYHENLNLFLKQRLAEFEVRETDLDQIFASISELINNVESFEDHEFNKWLTGISYHLLPKQVEMKIDYEQKKNNERNGLFISNVRDSNKYQVSKVNYLISAPIEIHVIEVLWCLFAGPALESSMSKDSYGNRMHPEALKYVIGIHEKKSKEVFKRYIHQYNKWRDQAIHCATEIAKNGDNVALLSLDLKSYYYHVDLNFNKIGDAIKQYYNDDSDIGILALNLNFLLEKIYICYRNEILPRIKQTHVKCKDKNGLPIGFMSSAIIANWYLSDFDTCIGDNVRPVYYGRYVDDIIMVFKNPKFDVIDPVGSFIKHYLDKALAESSEGAEYVINVDGNELPMQKDKLILQYFDKEHSRAGLEVFKKELDERSSAFKFLPNDHIDNELDHFAYDILYDGSANKLRSIVWLSENETELAKYLSSHITAHRLCKLDKHDSVLPQVKQFFKGQNALQFSRLWEKIYQYAVITCNYRFVDFFYDYINNEISKIDVIMPNKKIRTQVTTKKLQKDLISYNQLSLALTVGLLDIKSTSGNLDFIFTENFAFAKPKRELNKLISYGSELHFLSWSFRYSNLVRHHLVAWPLANYSQHNGDLTSEEDFVCDSSLEIDERKKNYSPRFIHFDEWQIFYLGKYLDFNNPGGGLNEWMKKTINECGTDFFNNSSVISFKSSHDGDTGIVKSHLNIGGNDKKNNLAVAIANIKVHEEDIVSAIRKDSSPNLSFDRQQKLYAILNSALKEKVDLLVMPEVSIPVSWLPFMISFARRHQIGLIFGLEHWVANDVAYNIIIEALPFKISGIYKSCFVAARVKNHYAPAELEMLESIRLKPGNLSLKPSFLYHKVSWRGVSFATYNCFELSDITHRVLFKSEIDLLFACVWNKDTNYYQHIFESTVRDLHCYTVNANTSQYGGSCVLRPTKTDSKVMLYVKGGENTCVLTTNLDIKKLRDFQYKSKPSSKDYFKHLPPGYDSESILSR